MKIALLVIAAAFLAAGLPAFAAAPFTLAPLPYAANALEPHIDQATMEIHHGRHHAAYVNNLNAQVQNFPELSGLSLEALQGRISKFNAAVRNNGGGHYNHTLFWESMSGDGGGEPSGELAGAIADAFGSFDAFKEQFEAAGVNQFGSGWAWLVLDNGKLAVTSTANQDNPLTDGKTPLLGNDVWEHAYYLKYKNVRPEYLKAWWAVVDWSVVAARYAAAK